LEILVGGDFFIDGNDRVEEFIVCSGDTCWDLTSHIVWYPGDRFGEGSPIETTFDGGEDS